MVTRGCDLCHSPEAAAGNTFAEKLSLFKLL